MTCIKMPAFFEAFALYLYDCLGFICQSSFPFADVLNTLAPSTRSSPLVLLLKSGSSTSFRVACAAVRPLSPSHSPPTFCSSALSSALNASLGHQR